MHDTPTEKNGGMSFRRAGEQPGQVRSFAGIEMVWIPPGEFMMGSKLSLQEVARNYGREAEWYEHEHPRHKVTITQGFWLGKYVVTKAQWKAVMRTKPWKKGWFLKRTRPGVSDDPDSPVLYVSWEDAQAFIAKLNEKGEGHFRLPSEAEWEYACRAGADTAYCFGDDKSRLGEYAWYNANAKDVGEEYAHVVGQKKPNAWGLYDMHGNVCEYCADWYDEDYYGKSPERDPSGPFAGAYRVLRGGCLTGNDYNCRSAKRLYYSPHITYSIYGFRVARPASAR